MKIFIAGARAIKTLPKVVEDRLNNIQQRHYSVIIGDADGIDKAVQTYYFNSKYQDVTVYASNGKTRNNVGSWKTKAISVADNVKGFEFYSMKDKQMAFDADYGFMIWNGKSRGTYNNIVNLVEQGKTSLVFLTIIHRFFVVKSKKDLGEITSLVSNPCSNESYEQLTIF